MGVNSEARKFSLPPRPSVSRRQLLTQAAKYDWKPKDSDGEKEIPSPPLAGADGADREPYPFTLTHCRILLSIGLFIGTIGTQRDKPLGEKQIGGCRCGADGHDGCR